MRFLIRLIITAVALWAAVELVGGITYTGPLYKLLIVALVFGVVNAFVRPILTVLTCPLIVLTLGLFVLVLNALMLWLTSELSNALGIDFRVDGVWAAIVGGIIVGVVSAILNLFVKDDERGDD
jgi:putative membrane protein